MTSGLRTTDMLDEVCQQMYGHTNWSYVTTTDVDEGGTCIFFFREPDSEGDEEDENEDS